MGSSVRILTGDCRETLRELEAESVDCVVTSPPYYCLRDYGHDAQIGREESLAEYVAALVAVFAEVHRVLKVTGTVWLNLGDSYAGSVKPGGRRTNRGDYASVTGKQAANSASLTAGVAIFPAVCKPKDLMMVPATVALALRGWGWHLRSEIVWARPDAMPESVTDRPTKAHERIFLLTRRAGGYFYNDAAAVPVAAATVRKGERAQRWLARGTRVNGYKYRDGDGTGRHQTINESVKHHELIARYAGERTTRRLRNCETVPPEVWVMPSAGFAGAHYAAFPHELVRRCLAAGCPEGGTVLDPFGGSGTTGLVARLTGRSAILCELNGEYAELARRRIESGGRLDSDLRRQRQETAQRAEQEEKGQGTLFKQDHTHGRERA